MRQEDRERLQTPQSKVEKIFSTREWHSEGKSAFIVYHDD